MKINAILIDTLTQINNVLEQKIAEHPGDDPYNTGYRHGLVEAHELIRKLKEVEQNIIR